MPAMRFYVGTYTEKTASKGIYQCDLDDTSGVMKVVGVAAEVMNPSFLAPHPNGKFLYAVGEGGGERNVHAYAIEAGGALRKLNSEASKGAGACHLSVDPSGRCVMVAHYGSGHVSVLPVSSDGKVEPVSSIVKHEGHGTDRKRQDGPHAHSVNPSPDGRFALACDLGLDKVMVYKLDAAAGTIVPNDPPSASVPPGAGARHLAFHPSGEFAYVINEMGNSVTVFHYDRGHGILDPVETVGTLPADFSGTSYCAEVAVHPSGKWLYGSNRGHDSIAVFEIDGGSGKLTLRGVTPCGGKWPRHFAIDPSGKFVVVANQHTNDLVPFRIDEKTGAISPSGDRVEVPSAVCVRFLPRA
jgi:6-phosphogluconolactonase